MTDQLPERIWAKRGFAECCDGVWDEPVDMDGNPMGDEDMDDDDTPYLRADTAIPKSEADAMVAAAQCSHVWVEAADLPYFYCSKCQKPHQGDYMDGKPKDGCSMQEDDLVKDARAAFDQAVREAVEAEQKRILNIVSGYVGCENIVDAIRGETSE